MSVARQAKRSSSPAAALPVERWTQRHTLALVLIVLVAFGLRLAFWWGQSIYNPLFSHPTLDEQTHHELAQAVAEGRGVGPAPFFRAPLYYYLLGAAYAVAGPNPGLARFLGCVLGTISCYLIARLGRALAGPTVGLLAGAIAAIYWPMIFFDEQLQTAGLEVFLDVLMMLLFISGAQRGSWPLLLSAGITWGLSAITRANVLIIAPAMLLALWLWPRTQSRRPLRRWPCTALLLGGAALLILPVTLHNRIVGGEWVLVASSGGVNFYIGNNPRSDGRSAVLPEMGSSWPGRFEGTQWLPEAKAGRTLTHSEVSAFWFDRAEQWIRSRPADWLRLMGRKCRYFFCPLELPNDHPIGYFVHLSPVARVFWIGFPVIGVLGIAGLALLGSVRTWLLPVLFMPCYAASVVLFFCPARFRLPVMPVLILLGALGVVRAAALLANRCFKPLAAYGGLAVLAAVFIGTNPPDRAEFYADEQSAAHLQLGQVYSKLAVQEPGLREPARQHLEQAAELRPDDWSAHRALGAFCIQLGLMDEAYQELSRAVQLLPSDADNHFYFGNCLEAMHKPDQAAEEYRKTLELLGRHAAEPNYATELHHRLGAILAERGEFTAAIAEFEQVLRRDPNNIAELAGLGVALMQSHRYVEAAARFRQLLSCQPDNSAARQALEAAERPRKDLLALEDALRQAPDDLGAAGLLAWRLATSPDPHLRDGPRALAIVQHAIQIAGQPNAHLLQVLAAAYAECGRFDEAAAAAKQVRDMVHANGSPHEAEWIEQQLAEYQQKRPFHESN